MAIKKDALGAAIKKVRGIRGLTQIELAKAAGLSDGGKSLALIEQGRRSVSIETLNAIADALKIPPACLTVLGSTGVVKNKAATEFMQSLKDLISAVLLAQGDEDALTEAHPRSAKLTARRRKLASVE